MRMLHPDGFVGSDTYKLPFAHKVGVGILFSYCLQLVVARNLG